MKSGISRYDAYFFDYDGVIVDSVDIKKEAFAQLYSPYGKEVVEKVKSHHVSHGGMSRFDKIRYYHKTFLKKDISESEVMRLTEEYSRLVFEKVLKAPFIQGAPDFLELAKGKKKTMFVISGTPEDEIKRIIKKSRLEAYFRDIKGSPADKKENLRYLLERYHLDNKRCAYFGDSKEDLEAASELSVDFIPVNYFDGRNGYKDFVEVMEKLA